MKIRVDELPAKGRRLAGTVAPPDEASFVSGPIAFGVQLRPEGRSLEVAGWVQAIVVGECSRCLNVLRLPVDREVEAEFRPTTQAPDDEERELDADDLEVDYYPDDGLDLRAVLAEQILLGIPMKLLCGEDCRGLCPQCGVDRNVESCDCEPPTDPRLADLADLKDRL